MPYRFALVTGATSGIGAAFARTLPDGVNLLLTGRNAEALTAAARNLAREGRTVETVAADLTTEEGRAQVIARAEELEIDLLINNAGLGNFGPLLEQPPESEHKVVELNVVAVADLTRALLPGMLARGHRDGSRAGLIIVSSTTAFLPVPYMTTYAATKAFALYYAEGIAEEMRGEPVDVLALMPGPTRSSFGERAGFGAGNLPGALDPEAVADMALKALGRRTVLVTGRGPDNLPLEALLAPHRLLTGGLGQVMRLVSARFSDRDR
jgi:short-subunit dehydrogenase